MTLPIRPVLRAALLACACTLSLATKAETATELPPAASFFNNPRYSSPKLSPSGKYLAVKVALPGARERLSVIDLADNKLTVVAMFDDGDVGYFDWVNDNRLVYDSHDSSVALSDDRFGAGLYAVNRDGSGQLQLVQAADGDLPPTGTRTRHEMLSWDHYLLRQQGPRDSDDVYVTSAVFDAAYIVQRLTLMRLNTVTGRAVAVAGPGRVTGWLLDQQGLPRIAVADEQQREAIYYRDGDDDTATWRKLTEFNAFTGIASDSFAPVGFGPDGTLYVRAAHGDKSALFRFDMQSAKVAPQPLLALDEYDFDGSLIVARDKLLGIGYHADVYGQAWLDAGMKAVQASVDALLPGHVNLISRPQRPETPWALVYSFSDVDPGVYWLYNVDTRKVGARIGASYDQIDPQQMGRQTLVHYRARDGMDIPAWITYPHNSKGKQLPMVVLVHGGPYVHNESWGWNPEVQFLASRGYVVLEPQYRGTTGLGWHHFRAGWKQWGLKMQDDIADGTRWAIAQGIADPQRVCIAGASYGGYAVLMGLVNDPALYRCGVEWAGVTDIQLMYSGHWSFDSDLGDRWKQYGMPELIGDPVKDAAQLKATSPLQQAARIKQPLLLAYGTDDHRVPLYHGEKFYAAVKAGNPQVEWLTYEREGHGWALPQNRIDFWTRVEQFLEHNIGPQKADVPAQN